MLLRVVLLGLAVTLAGVIADAAAQTPAPPPPPIEGNIYSVTYVEVMPVSRADAVILLGRYRQASRQEDGNLRCETASRIGQPHQFVIFEVWKDQKAFEAHGKSTTAREFREKIHAIRNAPVDERVHIGVSVGALQPGPGGDAIYVATHVDVIPPRKDDAVAAIKAFGETARAASGNVRYEIVQQTNRPNHFTAFEVWRSRKAFDAHGMSASMREFRDKLSGMQGALYDERLYELLE